MTEKRFTFDNDSLLKDGEFWLDGSIATLCNAEEIVELLNELNDENEQSKMMIATLRNMVLENEDLERENKELKSLCKVLITHIEKKSIAFVIDKEVRRRLLE